MQKSKVIWKHSPFQDGFKPTTFSKLISVKLLKSLIMTTRFGTGIRSLQLK